MTSMYIEIYTKVLPSLILSFLSDPKISHQQKEYGGTNQRKM